MSHVRTQLRTAVAAALANIPGITTQAERVYNYGQSQIPAISVYSSKKPEQVGDKAKSTLDASFRVYGLVIEIRDKMSAGIDDALDAWAVLVEKEMAEDHTFGGLCIQSELVETEIEITAESEKPAGLCRLTYDVLYAVTRDDPETSLT